MCFFVDRGKIIARGQQVGGVDCTLKRITAPPILNPTEELILWDFRKESTHREWFCVCDEDINGHSVAKLEPNGKGTGVVFHGDLSTQLPADGVVRYSGYCAIRSKFKLVRPCVYVKTYD